MQIHELNSFSGVPGNTDFIPIDNGFDTSKISAEKFLGGKLNRPENNGDAGQILRSNGNGSTSWTDVGLPTDAQTQQAINDWLNNHPEATTTVQDGSLTYHKLVTGTLGFVTPEMFGAVGDGIADDTAALQNAFAYPFVFMSNKLYKITDPLVVNSNLIVGNNASIFCDFLSWKNKALDIVSDETIEIFDVTVDANDNAAICFSIDNETNVTTLKNVVLRNCIAKNTNNKASKKVSAGIFVYRDNYNVLIQGCEISSIKRESSNAGVIASVGIHVSHILGVCEVSNNYISGVFYEIGLPYDADGIEVYSKEATSALPENTAITISNNVLTSCQGRFIKIQGENAKITGNTMRNANIALIDNFRGVDLQVGGGVIANNVITLIDWTQSTEAYFVGITARSYAKLQCSVKIYANVFYSDAQIRLGICASCSPSLPTIINVIGNRINNVLTFFYLTGDISMSATAYAILTNNSLDDYTYSYVIDSTIETHVEVISNDNAGSAEVNISVKNLSIGNSVSTIKDFLDSIYALVPNLGVTMGNVAWTGRGDFTFIVNRKTATRADVTIFYNAHIYRVYHENDSSKYYFDYPGSSMA